MAKFTSNLVINTRWRNNDFIGAAGSSHTFPDAFYDEFLIDWAHQISLGNIVITETPTTGNIQMSTLTVGDIVLTGTATGDFGGGGGGGTTVIGTSPISVSTSSTTSTISLNANYQTAGTYVTGVSGTAPISTTGTTSITVSIDQSSLSTADALTASTLRTYVKNSSGSTITKGQAVYVTGADGTNALIGLASATAEATSSKTLGIAANTMTQNAFGYVIENGQLSNIDTSAASAGSSVWLGTTAGSLVFDAPPADPNNSVYLGVVTKANPSTGEILVKVQNGYELDELHDVSVGSPSDGDIVQWKSSSSMWTKASISNAGIASSVHTHAYQPSGTYITAVNGTSPISVSTTTAGIVTVGLSANYQTAGTYVTSISGTSPVVASTTTAGAATVSVSTGTTSETLATGNHNHDVTYIPKSTVTTAGDIIYATASSTVSRLGLGTAAQVLTVNAGATAPEWAAASGGGGMTVLQDTALSSSLSVSFSSIPQTYKSLYLAITVIASGGGGGYISAFTDTTGAGTFGVYYNIMGSKPTSTPAWDSFTTTSSTTLGQGTDLRDLFSRTGNGSAWLRIDNYASATANSKIVNGGSVMNPSSGLRWASTQFAGAITKATGTNAGINGFTLTFQAVTTGRVILYGVN